MRRGIVDSATVLHTAPPSQARRRLLVGSGYAAALASFGSAMPARGQAPVLMPVDTLLDDLTQRTFRFFWETSNPVNGLAPDAWPSKSACSIAALGFALTAYPVGVERGWITRTQARDRVLTTLRFLRSTPQGPEPMGRSGYRGFFYHFLDMNTGTRADENVELSSVDTALLLAGVLFCQSWFNGTDAGEAEIRALADELYARVDWRWMQPRPPSISHGWYPDFGFIEYDWKGYNEAMIVYLLALGSPTHAVEPDAWAAWTSTYERCWTKFHGQEHLHFASLFAHQFTHCWVDMRGIRDAYLGSRDMDYFENSRRATYAQREYASANPLGWNGYGVDLWGISACQGPADIVRPYAGQQRRFRSYAGRGVGDHAYDDGTIAPYAVASSLPFAPEIVTPTLQGMLARMGPQIYSQYGFYDAFNLSFDYDDVPLSNGQRIAGWGWVDNNYLGIDQGPMLAMLSNYKSQTVWRAMRGNPYLRLGLRRAGFTGGWLAA